MIFDSKAQALGNLRAKRRQARMGMSFLLVRAAQDAASRMEDISRQFKRACVIGPFDTRDLILSELPPNKHPLCFDYLNAPPLNSSLNQNPPYDLIISLLDLQSHNDLPHSLGHIRAALNPDGLFLGAIFGGQTLTELRQTLYGADQSALGGAAARVFPMTEYSQCAALLSHVGFALPVIDTDRLNVAYSKLSSLISDLRDIGLSNSLQSRAKTYLPKTYLQTAETLYREHFSREDGKLMCQFEILWMTGWAPHKSQQKPLKPGSAKMRLGDALNATERPLKR